MDWIKKYFEERSIGVECEKLVRNACDHMDIWLRADDILGGTLRNITVQNDDIREKIMRNNPKYLTENEMEEMQKPDEFTVHFNINEDGELS